ncbi:GNAT family N-acetyltransferase [Plastoroseomonas arctica]|uniref:GNAT family N-acetyltransferase n=1 Tax=Plastoroseomonas arctica TaxID=1509237 RepID=A0AAF1KL78_9PROT|nr:GNAT family N-acetyltransferase [Plastoroseomonas arctica]MBR0657555.1 GNAT family N-acetyltransferase [Plastoroseomonas arctica]
MLRIRHVTEEDFWAWRPLWDGYNAFYGRWGGAALEESVTQTTWSRLLDPAEPMQAIVAEEHGVLLGLAHLIFHRNTTLIGPVCTLQDLFTAEAARGRGIGRALIEAAYTQAREAGAARVQWWTHEDNYAARQLYDRMAQTAGFILYRAYL